MSLFEALLILALISLVAAASTGVIRLPASLALNREVSRLEAEMAIAARRAQSLGQVQVVELTFDPPLQVDDCAGGEAPRMFFKPNGDVNAVSFCLTVRGQRSYFRADWLTGRLIRQEEP